MKTLKNIIMEAMDSTAFAKDAIQTAKFVPDENSNSAFISDVYEAKDWHMTLQQFKSQLLAAMRESKIDLARCDLAHLYPQDVIDKSETKIPSGGVVHKIEFH